MAEKRHLLLQVGENIGGQMTGNLGRVNTFRYNEGSVDVCYLRSEQAKICGAAAVHHASVKAHTALSFCLQADCCNILRKMYFF